MPGRFQSGDFAVRRTATGYLAVLRVQGHEVSGHCTLSEAEHMLRHQAHVAGYDHDDIAGFSFKKLARGIGRIASKVAKIKALNTLIKAAKFLPPPVGTVAHVAGQALHVMQGMARGAPEARRAWEQTARVARRNPRDPRAVGMRLAMQAAGKPRWRSSAAADVIEEAGPVVPQGPAPTHASWMDANAQQLEAAARTEMHVQGEDD